MFCSSSKIISSGWNHRHTSELVLMNIMFQSQFQFHSSNWFRPVPVKLSWLWTVSVSAPVPASQFLVITVMTLVPPQFQLTRLLAVLVLAEARRRSLSLLFVFGHFFLEDLSGSQRRHQVIKLSSFLFLDWRGLPHPLLPVLLLLQGQTQRAGFQWGDEASEEPQAGSPLTWASARARFSSSSCRRAMSSLSCRASEYAERKVLKTPKKSSGCCLDESSPKCVSAFTNFSRKTRILEFVDTMLTSWSSELCCFQCQCYIYLKTAWNCIKLLHRDSWKIWNQNKIKHHNKF